MAGLHVLDVACGHGRLTRELARRGADVAGIDISGNLISRDFDLVACSFGLSDIDDLDGAIRSISSALRPGASFAFSILHPCFAGGQDISGSWPAAGSYYEEGRWTAQEARSALRRQVGASHRMLSTYLGTLRRHDLWLEQIVEPVPAPDWDPAHDADRKPVYLAARSVKVIES
ncbi:MAG TPA: class I SAM-dependent methyltransferase [Streptosporangiaceae bacterium]|nr:class I SAM-dependent methyltransferase [Streptosporangiaceae bacterium]